MKAEYDTTCDYITGPNTTVPGTRYEVNHPCRLVSELVTLITEYPNSLRTAYVTLSAPIPTAPILSAYSTTLGLFAIAYGVADRLAIPSGGPATHVVLWTEIMTPYGGPAYYRAHVAPLGSIYFPS